MAQHRVIGPDDPHYPEARKRFIVTLLKTVAGYAAMVGLIIAALVAFRSSFHPGWGLLWCALPVVMWWFSAKVALFMTKSTPADPSNPTHKRLIDIVDRVYAKSGLKFKPPVYISDNPLPNAFATGPIHRRAVVAATKGLFECGMTDEEIEAVFAHELGHVKNYDVAINSLLGVLSSFFFLVTDAGIRALVAGLNIFRRIFGVKPYQLGKPQGFLTGILDWVIMYAIFWLTGQLTRVIQLFVVRSRESAADATATLITGRPCDLSTALQKLVAYVEKNRPKGRDASLFGDPAIMIVDPIYDARNPDPKPTGVFGTLKRWWKLLQLTHPPVPERIAALEKMNGGSCPRI